MKSFFEESLSTVAVRPDVLASAYFVGMGDTGAFSEPGNPGISGTCSGTKLIATLCNPGMAPSHGALVVISNRPSASVIPDASIPVSVIKPTDRLGIGFP